MSLTDNNNEANKNPREEKAQAGSFKGFNAQQRGRGDLFDGPLVRAGSAGNELSVFVERFNSWTEANKSVISAGGQLSWTVVPAASSETQMKLDAAVIVGKAITEGAETVCALTLIFTGGKALPKQVVEVGDRRDAEYSAVANDQYTKAYQNTLTDLIARKAPEFSIQGLTLMGAVTITNSNLNEEKCNDIISSSINTVFGYLGNILRTSQFSLASLDKQRSEFTSRVIYNQGDALDPITEQPRRRDLTVEVSLSSKERRNKISNSLENAEGALDVATIEGFVDLVYLGLPEGQSTRRGRFSRRNDDNQSLQMYGMNLNITHMQHEPSPEHMCLALAQIPVLINENVLVTGLKPSGDNAKLRTPEALTYEVVNQTDEKFEDIPEVLDDNEWASLTEQLLRPDQNFVTVLIDETGINTQQQKLLVNATDRDNPSREMYADMLVGAGDNLTQNRFLDALDHANVNPSDIGIKLDQPVLLGTWVDSNGQIRALSEIDVYAITTAFGQKDPRVVLDWERCMTDTTLPLEMRLAKMEEIIGDFTGGSYTVTGHASAILLNTQWLFALTNAAEAAGMVTSADGIYQDTRFRRGFQSNYATGNYNGKAFRPRGNGRYGFNN